MSFETYAMLMNKRLVVPSQKTSYVAVERDHLSFVLRPHIERVQLDSEWYLERYPDVREAITRGDLSSATEHYVTVGYYEHRMPHSIEVDGRFYLEHNPDVEAAVEAGIFSSARAHFETAGFREGRFPSPGFRLN